jgi:hypothetical protein
VLQVGLDIALYCSLATVGVTGMIRQLYIVVWLLWVLHVNLDIALYCSLATVGVTGMIRYSFILYSGYCECYM